MSNFIELETITSFLQENTEYGILDIGTMQSILMTKKMQEVKKIHTFAITSPKEEGGRWQTYIKDTFGKRKCLKAKTEEELLKKLVEFYFDKRFVDKMTFEELFLEWLDYKSALVNSPNTITRHKQHYKKYFASSALPNKTLKQLDCFMLETEFNRIVKEGNLTRKEWTNVKTIPNGMFEYAVRKGYLDKNPMEKVFIQVQYRQTNRKTGKTETYNSKELLQLNQYLDAQFSETGDAAVLAVKLNFLLGLRVGELVALKWSDIEDNHLHITREEIRNQENGVYQIVEHTKTHTDRFVYLIPKAAAILGKLEKESEYIFTRNGERLTSRQIAYVLEKYAKQQGIHTKSTHKMRKTFASNLSKNGVPLDAIRELLGHSNLQTTLNYIYNPLTDEETADLIAKAL